MAERRALQRGWTGPADIAYCPEHGLHGCRTTCFTCGGPVEQVRMVPLKHSELSLASLAVAIYREGRNVHTGRHVDDEMYDALTAGGVERYLAGNNALRTAVVNTIPDPCQGADEQHERHLAICVPFYEWRDGLATEVTR